MTGNTIIEKSTSTPEKMGFEPALEQLQVALKKLESGELSLEQSLLQFEEGVKLTRICQEYLTAAEQRVEILTKANAVGQIDLQPFQSTRS